MTGDKRFQFEYSGTAIIEPARTLGIIRLMEAEFIETARRQLRVVG